MKFEEYVMSFLPDTHVILGIKLKHLSLGHYLLMRRLDVGYATDTEAKVGFSDFVLALLICSMTYEEFIAYLERPDFIKRLKKESRNMCKVIKKEDGFNLFDKMKNFEIYLKEGTKMPLYWEGDNTSDKKSGAHWSQTLFTTAVSELGYTRTQALNVPLVQLFNDFYKFAESSGAVSLMQPDEEDQIKETIETAKKESQTACKI